MSKDTIAALRRISSQMEDGAAYYGGQIASTLRSGPSARELDKMMMSCRHAADAIDLAIKHIEALNEQQAAAANITANNVLGG